MKYDSSCCWSPGRELGQFFLNLLLRRGDFSNSVQYMSGRIYFSLCQTLPAWSCNVVLIAGILCSSLLSLVLSELFSIIVDYEVHSPIFTACILYSTVSCCAGQWVQCPLDTVVRSQISLRWF